MDEELLLWMNKVSGFLRWSLLLRRCCEHGWHNNKEFSVFPQLTEEAGAVGLRALTPVLKDILLQEKHFQTALRATEKLFMKGAVNQRANFIAVLFQEIATVIPLILFLQYKCI